MAGWDLLVCWKDESESWVKLSDMKESHPVEMAEFAKAKGIQGQPAFCWGTLHPTKKGCDHGSRSRKATKNHTQVWGQDSKGCPSCTGTGQKEWKHHVDGRACKRNVQRGYCF